MDLPWSPLLEKASQILGGLRQGLHSLEVQDRSEPSFHRLRYFRRLIRMARQARLTGRPQFQDRLLQSLVLWLQTWRGPQLFLEQRPSFGLSLQGASRTAFRSD